MYSLLMLMELQQLLQILGLYSRDVDELSVSYFSLVQGFREEVFQFLMVQKVY